MRYLKTYENYKDTRDNQLSESEKKSLNYILGLNENLQINEGVVDRLKKIAKRGLLTATLLGSLLNNSAFAQEYKKLGPSDKHQIEQMITNDKTSTSKDNIVDVGSFFKSGVYEISDDSRQEILTKLQKLSDYMQESGANKFSVTIVSSESKVPNKDANTGERLEVGELSKKRAEETRSVLREYLKSIDSPVEVSIKVDTKIGDTKWTNDDARSDKYTKDQYVKIIINVDGDNANSLCNLIGEADTGSVADESQNYISYTKSIDTKDMYGSGEIVLTPGAIPDRVQIVADGEVIGDSGYFVDNAGKYQEFKYVPRYVAELTKLNKKGVTAGKSSTQKQMITKSFDSYQELVQFLLKDQKHNYKADKRSEIAPALKELESMFNAGQREFVFYDLAPKKLQYKLNGDYKEVKVVVYSPLGQTGFGIKANCGK